jgi:hypothetical protein
LARQSNPPHSPSSTRHAHVAPRVDPDPGGCGPSRARAVAVRLDADSVLWSRVVKRAAQDLAPRQPFRAEGRIGTVVAHLADGVLVQWNDGAEELLARWRRLEIPFSPIALEPEA